MFASQGQGTGEYGAVVSTPKHHEGYCAIEQIGALAKGLHVADESGNALNPGMLPFVGNARFEGERWQLRIEPPAMHNVNGTPTWACRWIFALAAGGADQNR